MADSCTLLSQFHWEELSIQSCLTTHRLQLPELASRGLDLSAYDVASSTYGETGWIRFATVIGYLLIFVLQTHHIWIHRCKFLHVALRRCSHKHIPAMSLAFFVSCRGAPWCGAETAREYAHGYMVNALPCYDSAHLNIHVSNLTIVLLSRCCDSPCTCLTWSWDSSETCLCVQCSALQCCDSTHSKICWRCDEYS